MSDVMTFPATFEEFAKTYKIVDSEQIYTNGTELIPVFRVNQWLEHISEENQSEMRGMMNYCQNQIETAKSEAIKEFAERLKKHSYFDHKDQRKAVAEIIIDHYIKKMVGED